jgi:hypothetical protein
MAATSEEFTELADEFALVAQTAAEAGTAGGGDQAPRVRRGWVDVPAGGHVSGVFWSDGPRSPSRARRPISSRSPAGSRTVAEIGR